MANDKDEPAVTFDLFGPRKFLFLVWWLAGLVLLRTFLWSYEHQMLIAYCIVAPIACVVFYITIKPYLNDKTPVERIPPKPANPERVQVFDEYTQEEFDRLHSTDLKDIDRDWPEQV